MEKEKRKLILIAIIALLTFLITYAYAFYLMGYFDIPSSGFLSLFLILAYFALLTACDIYFIFNPPYTKRGYVIMASINGAFILFTWFVIIIAKINEVMIQSLWYPIVVSIASLIMILIYILIIIDVIKMDKKIEKKLKEDDKE